LAFKVTTLLFNHLIKVAFEKYFQIIENISFTAIFTVAKHIFNNFISIININELLSSVKKNSFDSFWLSYELIN
jgi:hypothetical protein